MVTRGQWKNTKYKINISPFKVDLVNLFANSYIFMSRRYRDTLPFMLNPVFEHLPKETYVVVMRVIV